MNTLTRKLEVLHDKPDASLLKVAFASTDRKSVNQHFGAAKSFATYGVNQNHRYLLNVSQFGELQQDGNEDKLAIKLDLLEDCIAVYCRACGASGVRQLLARGIQPVKVSEGTLIEDLLQGLQQELKHKPSPWLARALGRNKMPSDSRFDDMETEGWQE